MEKFRFIIFGNYYDMWTAVNRFGWHKMYKYYRLRKIISLRYLKTRKQFRQMMDEADVSGKGFKMEADFWLSWFLTGIVPEDYFDMMFFRKNWTWRNHHVTRYRLAFIQECFNSPETIGYVDNKALFNAHWEAYLNRKWCVPQDVTFERFAEVLGQCKKIVVKDVDGFGGTGVRGYAIDKQSIHTVFSELRQSPTRQVAEEHIIQKGYFHDVNPGSVNTIRVTTVRIGEEIQVLFAYLRTGVGNSLVDNMHSGGIAFEIDRKTGTIQTGQSFNQFDITVHPYSKIKVAGHVIDRWEEILAFVKKAHLHAPEGQNLIGWDVCVSDDGLSLIEGGSGPGFPRLLDPEEDLWGEVKGYLDRVCKS